MIDWLLDIPFRHDIAVLTPERTERLQRSYFGAGDEVLKEGDVGDTAYIVNSGRLVVRKGGVAVSELAEGDRFGEIALLSGVTRTATVQCLTDCDLTVLVRDDFQSLSAGRGALAAAIRRQADDRYAQLSESVGMGAPPFGDISAGLVPDDGGDALHEVEDALFDCLCRLEKGPRAKRIGL